MVFKDTSTDTSTAIWQAIINAVVMILGIGCMTFIIVLLYKFHFIKVFSLPNGYKIDPLRSLVFLLLLRLGVHRRIHCLYVLHPVQDHLRLHFIDLCLLQLWRRRCDCHLLRRMNPPFEQDFV